MLFWLIFGDFWCPVETLITLSSNLSNFERNAKKLKYKKKITKFKKNQKIKKKLPKKTRNPKKNPNIQKKNKKKNP